MGLEDRGSQGLPLLEFCPTHCNEDSHNMVQKTPPALCWSKRHTSERQFQGVKNCGAGFCAPSPLRVAGADSRSGVAVIVEERVRAKRAAMPCWTSQRRFGRDAYAFSFFSFFFFGELDQCWGPLPSEEAISSCSFMDFDTPSYIPAGLRVRHKGCKEQTW